MLAPASARLRATQAARLFHALSDETRLAVLAMLRGGERCVCDLQGALDAAQSRLSFHLKVLREAGLVADRKEGRWSYYALVPGALDGAQAFLGELAEPRAAAAPRLVPLGRGGAARTAATTAVATGRPGRRGGGDCCA